jgi:predicted HicB family RNase H-like nuclease
MTKDSRLAIRIDPVLKEKAEALAKADRRTLSSWVEGLIEREVEKAEAAALRRKK